MYDWYAVEAGALILRIGFLNYHEGAGNNSPKHQGLCNDIHGVISQKIVSIKTCM
jgi:hypothetical protein